MKGTVILNALLKDIQLDFFILCSSLNSIVGLLPEPITSCAANAFFDAYAHHLCAQGTQAISINWDTWQETGERLNSTAVSLEYQEGWGENPQPTILPKEGIEVFNLIVGNTLPQVLVSTYDLTLRIEKAKVSSPHPLEKIAERDNLFQQKYTRPELSNAYIEPRTSLEQMVVDVWQKILGFEQIGIFDNFFELGGDSILATQVISEIRETCEMQIPMETLFEKSTVADIAEYIEDTPSIVQDLTVLTNTTDKHVEGEL